MENNGRMSPKNYPNGSETTVTVDDTTVAINHGNNYGVVSQAFSALHHEALRSTNFLVLILSSIIVPPYWKSNIEDLSLDDNHDKVAENK